MQGDFQRPMSMPHPCPHCMGLDDCSTSDPWAKILLFALNWCYQRSSWHLTGSPLRTLTGPFSYNPSPHLMWRTASPEVVIPTREFRKYGGPDFVWTLRTDPSSLVGPIWLGSAPHCDSQAPTTAKYRALGGPGQRNWGRGKIRLGRPGSQQVLHIGCT